MSKEKHSFLSIVQERAKKYQDDQILENIRTIERNRRLISPTPEEIESLNFTYTQLSLEYQKKTEKFIKKWKLTPIISELSDYYSTLGISMEGVISSGKIIPNLSAVQLHQEIESLKKGSRPWLMFKTYEDQTFDTDFVTKSYRSIRFEQTLTDKLWLNGPNGIVTVSSPLWIRDSVIDFVSQGKDVYQHKIFRSLD